MVIIKRAHRRINVANLQESLPEFLEVFRDAHAFYSPNDSPWENGLEQTAAAVVAILKQMQSSPESNRCFRFIAEAALNGLGMFAPGNQFVRVRAAADILLIFIERNPGPGMRSDLPPGSIEKNFRRCWIMSVTNWLIQQRCCGFVSNRGRGCTKRLEMAALVIFYVQM